MGDWDGYAQAELRCLLRKVQASLEFGFGAGASPPGNLQEHRRAFPYLHAK